MKQRKMQIIDSNTGEIELEKDFIGEFLFQFTCQEANGNIRRIGRINNASFGEKHNIKNWYYQPITAKLTEKFEELAHIRIDSILFLQNIDWSPPEGGPKKWTWIARIKKAGDILENTWGYDYVMEIKDWYASQMTLEQIIALVYHELRHIGGDGELLHHEVEDWNNLVATLGVNWATTQAEIVNLLGDEFEGFEELRSVGKQLSLYHDGGSAAMSAGMEG